MATTIKRLIELAMMDVVALTENEEADPSQLADGMSLMSDMIEQWSVEGMMVAYTVTETLIGDTSKSIYYWGAGLDIPSVAPVDVVSVSFQIENGQQPLERVDQRFMNEKPWVGIVAMPCYFTYVPNVPPFLQFDCPPYGGGFNILSEKPLDSTTVLQANLSFPAKYNRVLRTNLAIELCPAYEKTPSQALIALATESKKILKRSNRQPVPNMRTDLPGTIDNSVSLPLRN